MLYHEKPMSARTRCLECGDRIKEPRSNKLFCSTACKNAYHNSRQQYKKICKEKTLRMLDRNYQILSRVMSLGLETISLGEASALGFRPNVLTSFVRSDSCTMCGCFDISYRISENKIFKIRRLSVDLQSNSHTSEKK